jgi:hypothetical protein
LSETGDGRTVKKSENLVLNKEENKGFVEIRFQSEFLHKSECGKRKTIE